MTNSEYNSLVVGSIITFNDSTTATDYYLKPNTEYYVLNLINGVPVIHNEVGEVLYIHRRYMSLFDLYIENNT